MRPHIRFTLFLAAGFAVGLATTAELAVHSRAPNPVPSAAPLGPHGGSVMESRFQTFEVKVDRNEGHVDVWALRLGGQPPQNMSITLFRDPLTKQQVDLQAVEPMDPQVPHYQGQLTIAYDKYMAFGLTWHFSLGPTTEGPIAPAETG